MINGHAITAAPQGKADFFSSLEQYFCVMVPDELIHHKPGLFFRGDARLPTEIFNTGFTKRDPTFKNPVVTAKSGIAPTTAICFSRLIEAAALFPQSFEQPITYIYFIWVEKRFNTHRMQTRIVSQQIKRAEKKLNFPECFLFAEELCTNEIPYYHVLAAIEVLNKNQIINFHKNIKCHPMHDELLDIIAFDYYSRILSNPELCYIRKMSWKNSPHSELTQQLLNKYSGS